MPAVPHTARGDAGTIASHEVIVAVPSRASPVMLSAATVASLNAQPAINRPDDAESSIGPTSR